MIRRAMVLIVYWPVAIIGLALVLAGDIGVRMVEWVVDFELEDRQKAAERKNGS